MPDSTIIDTSLGQWAVVALEHPALRGVQADPCEECLSHTRQAIIMARLTGSVGATHQERGHSVTVSRAHGVVRLSGVGAQPAVLLVDSPDGDVVGVLFPDRETARDWEDAHDTEIGTVRGAIPLVPKEQVLPAKAEVVQ